MRKFLAILCSVALVMSSLTVYGATDPYDFDGDIIENPWGDLFTTTAEENTTTETPTEETTEEVTTGVDKPATPVGLTYAGNTDLPHYFAWAPVDGAVSYNFYINGTKAGSSTVENYNAALDLFTTIGDYIIGVTAVNEAGVESDMATITYTVSEVVTEAPTTEAPTTEAPTEVETTTEEATTASSLAITKQPQSVSAEAGEYVNISVEATGEGLTYQWQMSNDNGSTWTNSSAVGTAPNNINVLMKDTMDGRQYRCVITDANGNKVTSDAATLSLPTAAMEITSQPQDASAEAGQYITISVTATGDGLTYQWQMSDDNGNTWTNSAAQGDAPNSINVLMRAAISGRQYRCVITDANGNTVASSGATITLK